MPRKILATTLQVRCPNPVCHKVINIRLESGQSNDSIPCWNCHTVIETHNGYGKNNIRVSSQGKSLQFHIVWQEKE